MNNREVALDYIRHFCDGDVEGLKPLLADKLRFNGTFHSYNSAEEYLEGLREDPPEKCQYCILSITENSDSVAVFYDYEKKNGVLKIAQLFKVSGRHIHEILLIFDSHAISKESHTL